MGQLLAALLRLQSVEHQLSQVKGRWKRRKGAVIAQQARVDQLQGELDALKERSLERRKGVDSLELDLKTKEQEVSKLRAAMNKAKTNKEYAAILTQLNTAKVDNSKFEEGALIMMQELDTIQAEAEKLEQQIASQQERLQEVRQSSDQEISRLTEILEDLVAQRAEAAKAVPPVALAIFDRISESYGGDAMAVIEIHGKKPPHHYVCGGCFMSLSAEHANVLKVRDELRTCDNCGRILYLKPENEPPS